MNKLFFTMAFLLGLIGGAATAADSSVPDNQDQTPSAIGNSSHDQGEFHNNNDISAPSDREQRIETPMNTSWDRENMQRSNIQADQEEPMEAQQDVSLPSNTESREDWPSMPSGRP